MVMTQEFRHGASNGDSLASYYLGTIYQQGLGKIIPDQMRANRHYKNIYKDIHAKAKKGDLRYINILAASSPASVRRLAVDLNYKLAFPFTAMVTVMVGIPFSIATGRVNALLGMARGISIAMLYLPVMAVCLALGKSGVLPPVLSVWLGSILFAGLGAYFVNKRS